MGVQDLAVYLDKHCRFRFRGGKEAFGVIWKTGEDLVFSSKEFHNRMQSDTIQVKSSDLLTINSDDVMMAEVIS